MDIEQARTFLSIATHGSFVAAAQRLHLTQSTVSARIRTLETDLGVSLFVRNRSGATLTPAGRRFLQHAKTLVLTAEQARHDLGLTGGYTASIRLGARIALWDGLLPAWVGWMREHAPDVSIRSEIGFEEDLMRRLVEGTLDVGLMYTPSHGADLQVEHLVDERLILISSKGEQAWPDPDYVYVDWGPGFYGKHLNQYPDLARPPHTVNIGWLAVQLILENGGSCYLPERMARPLLAGGRVWRVRDMPDFGLPAYMVYARDAEHGVVGRALQGLRQLVIED